MFLSQSGPYFDIIIQQLSDLMIEAKEWPEATHIHVYSFWADVDQFKILFALSQPSVGEIRVGFNEVCCKLESVEQVLFNRNASWHLDMLRQALASISYLVDELPATDVSNSI